MRRASFLSTMFRVPFVSHERFLGRRKLMVSDAAEVMADRTDGHTSSGSSFRGARALNLFRTAMLNVVARLHLLARWQRRAFSQGV